MLEDLIKAKEQNENDEKKEVKKMTTREELLTVRQYLTVSDICKIFDCSVTIGYRIMREIKAQSDIMGVSGKVTVSDYEVWFNSPARAKTTKQKT